MYLDFCIIIHRNDASMNVCNYDPMKKGRGPKESLHLLIKFFSEVPVWVMIAHNNQCVRFSVNSADPYPIPVCTSALFNVIMPSSMSLLPLWKKRCHLK